MTDPIQPVALPVAPETRSNPELAQVAEELEASFLAEMLKHAQFGEARTSFGGGAGEDHFASLLRTEHAKAMVEAGGIGLSEAIFNSLVAREAAGSQP